MVGRNAHAVYQDVSPVAARSAGDCADRNGREVWRACLEGPDLEFAGDAEGSGQPARCIAAEGQRVSGPTGTLGRGDQSEPPDRSGPGKTLRADWQSRSPLPQRSE